MQQTCQVGAQRVGASLPNDTARCRDRQLLVVRQGPWVVACHLMLRERVQAGWYLLGASRWLGRGVDVVGQRDGHRRLAWSLGQWWSEHLRV
jgi:hypothetical protein